MHPQRLGYLQCLHRSSVPPSVVAKVVDRQPAEVVQASEQNAKQGLQEELRIARIALENLARMKRAPGGAFERTAKSATALGDGLRR